MVATICRPAQLYPHLKWRRSMNLQGQQCTARLAFHHCHHRMSFDDTVFTGSAVPLNGFFPRHAQRTGHYASTMFAELRHTGRADIDNARRRPLLRGQCASCGYIVFPTQPSAVHCYKSNLWQRRLSPSRSLRDSFVQHWSTATLSTMHDHPRALCSLCPNMDFTWTSQWSVQIATHVYGRPT